MILSHPDRFRHVGGLAGDLYEAVMKHVGAVSVAEAVGALELVKAEIIKDARDDD